jgi:hypothetical protein
MWLDVVVRDDVYGCDNADGNFLRLALVSAVLPGWRPLGVFVSSTGPAIAEFTDERVIASWFLDAKFERLGGTVWELGDEARELMASAFRPTVESIANAVLAGDGHLQDAFGGFRNINAATRRDIISLATLRSATPHFVQIPETAVPDWPFIGDALSVDIQDAAIEGASRGDLQYVDPSNGRKIPLAHSILLDDFRFIYPVECADGQRAYACAAGHYNQFLGLYRHDTATFYTQDADAAVLSFGGIVQDIIAVAALYADSLADYLRCNPTKLSFFLRPPPANHLGHQLRDELSGLERLSALGVAKDGLSVVVPAADGGTEIFGTLEEIFTEDVGNVIRLPSHVDFREESYRLGLCLVRQTYPYVSASLRKKLEERILRKSALEPDMALLARLKAEGKAVVLFGLRVENRTLIGLDGFVREFVALLSSLVKGGALVLDGFNSWGEASDQIYHSNEAKAAKRLPIDVERELAASITDLAPPNIEIINLVGATVDRSLFWSIYCDCFIAMWGAGLAKYRWAANRPGYVLTSAWNLRHRSDLHIYDSPSVMEAPTELEFVESTLVYDQPEAEMLSFQTDQAIESYFNFAGERDGTFKSIREFLCRHLVSS